MFAIYIANYNEYPNLAFYRDCILLFQIGKNVTNGERAIVPRYKLYMYLQLGI